LFPRQEIRFWASRSVIDPRVSVSEVARRIGRSRTAVQARLRSWDRTGFLLGSEVWPNPGLFGVGLATTDLPVRSPAHAEQLFEDLSLVDGILSAREFLNEDGRTVRAYLVDDGSTSLERRRRLLRRVANLALEPEIEPYWIPETFDYLSSLDWRILSFYRAYPGASLTDVAGGLGISLKTLSTRRDRLLDGHAMWWLLNTRSSRFPTATFFVRTGDPAVLSSVKRTIEARLPGWIPCADDGFGVAPGPGLCELAGVSPVDSPASVDDVARLLGRVPGVASVRWRVPRDFRSYHEWYDQQLRQRLASSAPRAPRRERTIDAAERAVVAGGLLSLAPARPTGMAPSGLSPLVQTPTAEDGPGSGMSRARSPVSSGARRP
jgi:DNA-binding Lrp family transcriptional regulator